ncbi:MAG TPA: ABC transporter permease [Gemmatimonadaceae bacterium]|nr:ABC transporter permease [Gemmatimonadaceae bacterium]
MRLGAELRERVRALLFRRREERELEEELAFHVEMEAREHIAAGVGAGEARRRALLALGGMDRVKEEVRDARGTRMLEDAVRDVRYAVRGLWRRPGFTVVAVLTLGLGIGGATAVFTLVSAVLLRSPYRDAGRLVLAYQTVTPGFFGASDTMPWSYPSARELGRRVPAFAEAAGFFTVWDDVILTGEAGAERVRTQLVTPEYFGVLGARAVAGRLLGAADGDGAASGGAAVLSHRLWAGRFGRDPGVVGRTLRLNGVTFTVVGVAAAGFDGLGGGIDVWLPFGAARLLPGGMGALLDDAGAVGVSVAARLRDGATFEQAAAQVSAAAAGMRQAGAGSARLDAGVAPLLTARFEPRLRSLLVLLAAAVATLLLMVCVNQASLLLARSASRRAEVGVRLALGAGWMRLARQALTETLLLAGGGALLGVAFSVLATRALVTLWPRPELSMVLLRGTDLLHGAPLRPDGRVLLFAVGVTVVVALAVGLAPAIGAARLDPAARLRGDRGALGGAGASRGRHVLVVCEVALATALLAAAGLLTRSLERLLAQDPGVSPAGVTAFGVNVSQIGGGSAAAATGPSPGGRSGGGSAPAAAGRERSTRVALELVERVSAVPGVDGATLDTCLPLAATECAYAMIATLDGRRVPPRAAPAAVMHAVTPGYLRVLGIPLRRGRALEPRDRTGPPVVLLNEAAARRYFPGASALGRRIGFGPIADAEVVGVVGDVKQGRLEQPAPPAVYTLLDPLGAPPPLRLLVRAAGPTAATVAAVRREARALDPGIAVYDARPLDDVVAAGSAGTRFVAAMLGFFAVAAAAMAALGVYGVLAYEVARRTREIGVRVALGASPGRVLAPMLGRAALLVGIGLALGCATALAGSGVLRSFLFGVARTDPAVLSAIAALMAGIGLAAAWAPARRASRVDPALALRVE